MIRIGYLRKVVPKDESNTNEVVYFLLGITRLGQQQDTGI
jgi:hypothetical protein